MKKAGNHQLKVSKVKQLKLFYLSESLFLENASLKYAGPVLASRGF